MHKDKPELTFASFTAWFNVNELNPDQRDVVGQLVTSFANQNRIARKRDPYTAQLKPVFFQAAQTPKPTPPVTQTVSQTLKVVFTFEAQRLQNLSFPQMPTLQQAAPSFMQAPSQTLQPLQPMQPPTYMQPQTSQGYSQANQNRIARKRDPYTAQLKPVFFQVARTPKPTPPVTQR